SAAVPPQPPVPGQTFGFDRYGVRVPAVIVSPYVAPGTIFGKSNAVPFDHTTIIATVRKRFGINGALTARDAQAPDLRRVLPPPTYHPRPAPIKGPSLCTVPDNGRSRADQAAQLHAKGAGPACRQSSAAARQQSADSLGESEGDATPAGTRDRIGQLARRPGLRETAGGGIIPKTLKNEDLRTRRVGSGMGSRIIASACVSACDRPPRASFLGRKIRRRGAG